MQGLTPSFTRVNTPELRRAFWGACWSCAACVLVLSRWLRPDPSGMGTHRQLGLPACALLTLTGLPCPACGLTTAFAHMARWHLSAALRANPLGVPLFALTVAVFMVSIPACACAWSITDTLKALRVAPLGVIICALGMLVWIVRVATLIVA